MGDEPGDEEIRTVEVRVPVIRVPKLTSGDVVVLPQRQHVAELCDYLAEHLYEHRAVLDRAQFRRLLDDYARYRLLAAAGVEDYPHVIVEE